MKNIFIMNSRINLNHLSNNNNCDSNHVIDLSNSEAFNVKSKNYIPKQITLAWISLTIKATGDPYFNLPLSKKFKRQRTETILDKVNGIVEPGTLLALMGSR